MPKIIADEKVYQAVLEQVGRHGYAGATTKQMAEAAGISEVTLFRKYGSKLELVKQAILILTDRFNFSGATRYTGDPAADLLRSVQIYQDSAARYSQFFATLLSEIARTPELAEVLETPLDSFRSLEQLLARYQAEGVLLEEPTLHAAAALLGPLIYSVMLGRALAHEAIPPIDLEQHVQNFLTGRQVR